MRRSRSVTLRRVSVRRLRTINPLLYPRRKGAVDDVHRMRGGVPSQRTSLNRPGSAVPVSGLVMGSHRPNVAGSNKDAPTILPFHSPKYSTSSYHAHGHGHQSKKAGSDQRRCRQRSTALRSALLAAGHSLSSSAKRQLHALWQDHPFPLRWRVERNAIATSVYRLP